MNSRPTTALAWPHLSVRLSWTKVVFSLVLAAFMGCDRDPMVRVYDAPKDPPRVSRTPPRMAKAEGPTRFLIAVVPRGDRVFFIKASDRPERLESLGPNLRQIAATLDRSPDGKLIWKLPDGWSEKPGSGVTAAFLQSSEEEGSIRLSVTELGGPASADAWDQYLEDNINRWRGQLGLPATTIDQQKDSLVKIEGTAGESPTWIVDLQTEPTSEATTEANVATIPSPEVSSPSTKNANPSELKYKTPEGWKDEGPSGMRAASFSFEDTGSPGQVTVIIASGDRLSNVKRWQGQLMADASSDMIDELAKQAIANALTVKTSHGVEGSMYALSASETDDAPSMLAAIFPLPDSNASVFVKLTGDAKLTQSHRERFVQFISSLEW